MHPILVAPEDLLRSSRVSGKRQSRLCRVYSGGGRLPELRRRMLVLGFVRPRPRLILPAAASAVLATTSALTAQSANPDSVSLHEEAREIQARFERFRE